MSVRLAVSLAVAVLVAGCGTDRAELSPLCTEGEATVARALRTAPGPVALADGTRLSRCVAAARDIGELQSFGVIVTRVADRLADRGDALRLGYLIGAARRGAAHSEGVPAELVHRLEVTARRLPDAEHAQLARGLRAGERLG